MGCQWETSAVVGMYAEKRRRKYWHDQYVKTRALDWAIIWRLRLDNSVGVKPAIEDRRLEKPKEPEGGGDTLLLADIFLPPRASSPTEPRMATGRGTPAMASAIRSVIRHGIIAYVIVRV